MRQHSVRSHVAHVELAPVCRFKFPTQVVPAVYTVQRPRADQSTLLPSVKCFSLKNKVFMDFVNDDLRTENRLGFFIETICTK